MRFACHKETTFFLALLIVVGVWLQPPILSACAIPMSLQGDPDNASVESDRIGHRVRVSLPIDSKVSDNVINTLKELAEKAPALAPPEGRPVVVLEFETVEGKTGRGSKFASCLALASFLGEPEMNRLHTVAYIPASEEVTTDDDPRFSGQLNGHAVLVAIAANEMAIAPGVGIGSAGIDEDQIKPLFRDVYRNIADQRLMLPVPMVMSMLDKQLSLSRVQTSNRGPQFVNADELAKLESSGEGDSTTISPSGEFTLLTGTQLLDFGFVNLNPTSRTELARQLDLIPNSLDGDPALGKTRKAVQLDLPPVIDARTSKWIINSMKQQVGRNGVNLVILNIESNTGDVDACLRIANHLAEYKSDEVWTVAFVRDRAQGPVGLIALACTHLIMADEAVLGGQVDIDSTDPKPMFDTDELKSLKPSVKSLANEKESDWSMMMQMLDPTLIVTRYKHRIRGQTRLLSNDEFLSLEDPQAWDQEGPIGGAMGVDAKMAERYGLARTIAEDMGQIETRYELDGPPISLKPSMTDRWVERLATFLSSPFISPWLIFAAMIFLSTEMSAPGLGLPGFLSAVFFALFFWSNFFAGSADVLEILMFVIGVVFILVEIFALPGFGVFGIGGIFLVITSLVLASQSFFIPKSSKEVFEMSFSLLPLIAAGFGMITAGVLLRNIIPRSPFLNKMILQPRVMVDTGLGGMSDPEAIVDWSYLAGESGVTITRLNPSGKARIAGRVYDVISKGQMVGKGEPIEVIEAIGNRIVVVGEGQDD